MMISHYLTEMTWSCNSVLACNMQGFINIDMTTFSHGDAECMKCCFVWAILAIY